MKRTFVRVKHETPAALRASASISLKFQSKILFMGIFSIRLCFQLLFVPTHFLDQRGSSHRAGQKIELVKLKL